MTHNPAEALRDIVGMIESCADAPRNPDSLIMMVLAHAKAALPSPAPAGWEEQESQYNIEAIARVISLSYGEDPDEDAPLTRICTADNRPLPCWEAYREQANALMIWFSAALAVTPPPSPDVAGVLRSLQEWRKVVGDNYNVPALTAVISRAIDTVESLSAEKGRLEAERDRWKEDCLALAQPGRIVPPHGSGP